MQKGARNFVPLCRRLQHQLCVQFYGSIGWMVMFSIPEFESPATVGKVGSCSPASPGRLGAISLADLRQASNMSSAITLIVPQLGRAKPFIHQST